jgi:hypothetical protein
MVGAQAVASDAVNINPLTLGNTGTSSCGGPNQAGCTLEHATYLRPWDSKAPVPAAAFFDASHLRRVVLECPSGYTRSATAVTADDACWAPPTPVYEPATWQSQGTFAWNCTS